jgi:hypothetical protein
MGLNGRKGREPRVLPDHIWADLDAHVSTLSYQRAVDHINRLLREAGAELISLSWYKRKAPLRKQVAKRPLNDDSEPEPAPPKIARADDDAAASHRCDAQLADADAEADSPMPAAQTDGTSAASCVSPGLSLCALMMPDGCAGTLAPEAQSSNAQPPCQPASCSAALPTVASPHDGTLLTR